MVKIHPTTEKEEINKTTNEQRIKIYRFRMEELMWFWTQMHIMKLTTSLPFHIY